MFLDYYGLHEQPFGVTPDPRFLNFTSSHREALASLRYGIDCGLGFLALIAKPGMGKTTLLFHLLEKLQDSARTVFLFQTQCDSQGLLHSIMADLGITTQSRDLTDLQSQLNEVLLAELRAGKRFVLVIDEAQNLDDSVLETLRMLSNFEVPRKKLMHNVLSGQPQLADKLKSANLVQLRQRISILTRLAPLTSAETGVYISHRLSVAGYRGKPLFTPEALAIISHGSEGIPRNINNLCFHALTLGYAKNQRRISAPIVREVLADLSVESLGSNPMVEKEVAPDPILVFQFPARQAKTRAIVTENSYPEQHTNIYAKLQSAVRAACSTALVEGARVQRCHSSWMNLKRSWQWAHLSNIRRREAHLRKV
jgi:general secretion pathway protein A